MDRSKKNKYYIFCSDGEGDIWVVAGYEGTTMTLSSDVEDALEIDDEIAQIFIRKGFDTEVVV